MDVGETEMMIPMTLAEAVEVGIAVAAMVVGIGRMILGRTMVVHTAHGIKGVLALDLVRLGTRDVLLGLVRGETIRGTSFVSGVQEMGFHDLFYCSLAQSLQFVLK